MESERQSAKDGWREWDCDIVVRDEVRKPPKPGHVLGDVEYVQRRISVRVMLNLKEAARDLGSKADRSKGGKCRRGYLVVKSKGGA